MEKQYFFRAILQGLLDSKGFRVKVHERKPYWKMPEYDELTGWLYTNLPLEEVQGHFAEGWEFDTAQAERSNIFCPGVYFLWIGD